jgi:uncharacterized protein (TIGR03000 family)
VIVGSAPVVQTGFAQSPQHIVVGVPALEFEAARAVPNAAPARLTVELPEDAQLYVDGNLTKGTGITRNFHTPDLSNGSTYYYDLKAVVVVEGKTISEEKRVLVRSGEAVNDSFGKLIAAVKASKDALAAAK